MTGKPLEESDTACARLFRLVSRGAEMNGKGIDQPEGWSRLLGIPKTDLPKMYSAIGDFCNLIEEAKSEVAAIPHAEVYGLLESFNELASTLPNITVAPGIGWENVFNRDRVSPATIRGIKLAAGFVADAGPSRISIATLNELRAEMNVVQELIADCPPDIRAVLQRCVNAIKIALTHYEVLGADGLERAVEAAFGTLMRNQDVVLAAKESGGFKSTWDILTKISTIVSLAKNTKDLLQPGVLSIAMLIAGPSGDSPLPPVQPKIGYPTAASFEGNTTKSPIGSGSAP